MLRTKYVIEMEGPECRVYHGKTLLTHLTKHPRSPKSLEDRARGVIEAHKAAHSDMKTITVK